MSENEARMPWRVTAGHLWKQRHDGSCCACCPQDACPAESWPADGWWPDQMLAMTVNGVRYVGTRQAMMREDALTSPLAEHEPPPSTVELGEAPAWAQIPATVPPPAGRPQNAEWLDRCAVAHLSLHEQPGQDITHIYLGGVHVGWCLWSQGLAGIQIGELPVVRSIATACGIDLNTAAAALHTAQASLAGTSEQA